MKAGDAILNLGVRFAIEAPHTEHVTRLAQDLFDGFFPLDGLEKKDRCLLFAAAQLHDIAYATDPPNHVVEGARILAENPIHAFSTGEWRSIIGIALLHKRDWRAMLDHERFPKVGDRELVRIKKLAAILRVADGLDHGHIQDASIQFCRRGRKVDKVGVECKWYAGNIPWAEAKSDLWEAVFKRSFRIDGKLKQHRKMFKGIVHKRDPAVSAARRLLYSQWCIMRDNVQGMVEGRDFECLHSYCVALRRFRAALRMFKPLLEGTGFHELDDRLGELSDRLSPVRDAHVALQLFQAKASENNQYPETIRSLESNVAGANRMLREALDSGFCLQTVQLASCFLRVELPALERNHSSPLFAVFAQERLEPLLERILGQDVSNLREGDPTHVHEVRKLCRHGRYYAEFAAPVLDRQVRLAANHLTTITGALGDIHDARALYRRFEKTEAAIWIAQHENEAWERFNEGWRQIGES